MERNRIYSLDLLKFIVSIIIIFYHIQQETGLGTPVINLASGKIYAWYVVELFFIISGFFSMLSFASPDKTEETLKKGFCNYFKHKCIRIYPAAVLSILFTVFCGILYRIYFGNWWHNIVPSLWKLFKTLILFNGGLIKFDVTYGAVTWYLSVLLICYVLEFFIIYLCKRFSLNIKYLFALLVLLGIAGYCSNADLPFFYYYTYRGYASFFIGCIIFKAHNKSDLKRKSFLMCSIVSVVICVLAWIVNFDLFYDDETCQWGIATVVLWPSILIIFLELNKWFKSSFWQRLGDISFDMYLWHMPFIILWLIIRKLFSEFYLSELLQISIFIIFIIVFSFIIFTFVEKPCRIKLDGYSEIKTGV